MLFGKCLKLRGAGLNRPVMLIYFICGQCIPETGRFSESGIWMNRQKQSNLSAIERNRIKYLH